MPAGRARTRHFSRRRPQARHGEEGAEDEVFEALGRIREITRGLDLTMGQAALAWLLAQGVASVVAGSRNADQARENAAAADLMLPADALRDLADATEPLKEKLGPNLDAWQSGSRIR